MLKNYLKITFRSLWKSKLFVLINIIGMGLAIACSIVAYLNWDFDHSFDETHKNVESVYRINGERTYQNRPQMYGISPLPLGEAIEGNIGEVDAVLRYMPSGGNFKVGDELFNENFTYVDPNFFDFFTFNITSGDKNALNDPSKILINEQIVEKYFPEGDPIGKVLTQFTDYGNKEFTVAATFANQPENSSFGGVRILTNIDNYFNLQNQDEDTDDVENDWSRWSTTFVKVSDKSRIKQVEERLSNEFLEIQNNARLDFKLDRYVLESFAGMGQRGAGNTIYAIWTWTSMEPVAVIAPSVMAVLILLIACFNFTNTSMAIASKRLKEIGLRKVMGGLKSQLRIQFIMENVVLCFLSLIAGILLAFFLVPAYSILWPGLNLELNFTENLDFYAFLIAVLIFTGLIAGSYPAFYISSFEPARILKGEAKVGGTSKITSVLLTLQFSISLIAVILGVIFYQNAIYQKELDIGFDKDTAISLYFDGVDDYNSYLNVVRNNPDIKMIAGSEFQIDRSYRNDPVINGTKEYDVDILHIGENFFETMEFELLEGRKFTKDSKNDMEEAVIVSEEMVKVFGWEEPLGQKLVWMDTVNLYVIGVMKDAYIEGLWEPISPLMLRYVPEDDYHFLTVKTSAANLIDMNEYLEDKWKEVFPDKMYTGGYLSEEMSEAATVNDNILKIFGFLGVVASFMSIIGLFSIVSLSVLKRMKEVGVRKVLGASISHLMYILNRNFVIILLIASIIGSVLTYLIADPFLGMIWAYHIEPGISTFVLAVTALVVLALITISFKVYRAANTNPTETIRTE